MLIASRNGLSLGKTLVTEMGDVVNLNQFKKRKERTEAAKRAAENRTRFGTPKSERTKTRLETEKARKELEDKRLD